MAPEESHQASSTSLSGTSRLKYEEHLNRLLDDLRNIDLSGHVIDEAAYLHAHGGYCDIFTAKSHKHGGMAVAVKRLRVHIFRDKDASKMVLRELRVWSSLDHPNVLPLLGYVMHGGYPALVSKWMVNGSARNYMERLPDCSVLHMARGTAAGLQYLHDKDIIHSDLKCDNILVSDSGDPLLADFGISRIMHMTTEFASTNISTGAMGTTRWMAIELWLSSLGGDEEADAHMHTKQTDVWAFGMVVYELLTGRVPYYHLKNDLQVSFAIANGQIPSQPLPLNDEVRYLLWSICQRCWGKNPNDRPAMSSIVGQLSEVGTNSKETIDAPTEEKVNNDSRTLTSSPSGSDSPEDTLNATQTSRTNPLDNFKFLTITGTTTTDPSSSKTRSRVKRRPAYVPAPSPVTHPLLGIDAYTRTVALCWDVRLPPSTATIHPTPNRYNGISQSHLPNLPLESFELSLPATHPPAATMEVTIPQLPWGSILIKPKLVALARRRSEDGFVKVSDLLFMVYDSLQKRMRKEEWAALPPEKQRKITSAFYAHCRLVGQIRAKARIGSQPSEGEFNVEDLSKDEEKRETMNGLRRVDCLGDLTEFFGLSVATFNSKSRRFVWKLTLASPGLQ